ncbi:MAG: FAD-binding oxidoreductase, partial [Rhizobiaceae bacterium]|nr:FAD-binding oxidoreductase [Rhizobiaceae bacterium]
AGFASFAARVAPRGVIESLGRYAKEHGQVREECGVASINPATNEVILHDGSRLIAGEIIVANGVEAYGLLHPYMGASNDGKPLGRGVAGQALMVEFTHDDTLPILYQDGVYIIPHADNLMAIGSTSRNMELADMAGEMADFDADDMAFYEKALALAPMLKGAPIVEKWAGIRPRNTLKGRGADPWFEVVPGHDNLIALMGGFKITFGIAHRAMDVARGKIEGPRREKLSWVQ